MVHALGGPRRLAGGLGWPEGPSVLPDGRVVFVESYLGRLTAWAPPAPGPAGKGPEDGRPEEGTHPYAYTGGAPNATALGDDGCLYVTQNGGVVGPWRAPDPRPPSIQRVSADGSVEVVATKVGGTALRAPNDLAWGPDGRLYFTDPGGPYDPAARPDPGRIFVLGPDGAGEVLAEPGHVYPNGIAVDQAGSIVWVESYTGRVTRLSAGGDPAELTVLPPGHVPDGLAVAEDGHLYITATAAGGVDVLAPGGTYAGFLPVGTVPTNCAFDGSTLFVCDGGHRGSSAVAELTGVLWAVSSATTGQTLSYGNLGRPPGKPGAQAGRPKD